MKEKEKNDGVKQLREKRFCYRDMQQAFNAGREHFKQCGDSNTDCCDFPSWMVDNFGKYISMMEPYSSEEINTTSKSKLPTFGLTESHVESVLWYARANCTIWRISDIVKRDFRKTVSPASIKRICEDRNVNVRDPKE